MVLETEGAHVRYLRALYQNVCHKVLYMALSGYCMDASSRRDIYMDLLCCWYALDGYYGLQSTEVECSQLSQGIKIIL